MIRWSVRVISIVAILLSVWWFYRERGFEPAITTLLGIAGLVSSQFVKRERAHTASPVIDLDFYDRRRELYDAVREILISIGSEGAASRDEIARLARAQHEAGFLFDPKIVSCLEELRQAAIRLHYLGIKLDERGLPIGDERNRMSTEHGQLLLWFDEQLQGLQERFRRYLEVGRLGT
jgi:hypothetical protein